MQPDRTGATVPEDACNHVAVVVIGDSRGIRLVCSVGMVMSHLPNDHEKRTNRAIDNLHVIGELAYLSGRKMYYAYCHVYSCRSSNRIDLDPRRKCHVLRHHCRSGGGLIVVQ